MQGGAGLGVSIDYLELTGRNPPALKEVVQSKCVGIAGCGGLGSNIAMMLTRAGVGRLVLVDDDEVVLSNLNRQHFFHADIGKLKVTALAAHIRNCSKDIQVKAFDKRVNRGNMAQLFGRCDVVIEAFDNVADKAMIIQAFGEEPLLGRSLVCASGLGGLHSANQICTQLLTEHIYICGDTEHEGSDDEGVAAARVMIVAGHQALMVLRILCDMKTT